MTDSFLRQRRNLIIICGIFIFCKSSEINISSLSIAGMSFNALGNPDVVFIFLWITLIYFLYRFFVFYLENEHTELTKILTREIEKSVNLQLTKLMHKEHKNATEYSAPSYSHVKRSNWILHYQIYKNQDDSRRVENIVKHISRRDVILYEAKGILTFLTLTPAPTNYILPIALAIFVFIYCGLFPWPGSLINLINQI